MNLYSEIINMQKALDNLKLSVAHWECNKDLYSKDEPKVLLFKKGNIYDRNPKCDTLALMDETRETHLLGEWEKHFKAV